MAATSRFALYDSNPSICRKFLHYSLSKIPSFTRPHNFSDVKFRVSQIALDLRCQEPTSFA